MEILLERPRDARALFVFGHGAGAGMRHVFMQAMATRLADRGVATLRYPFPNNFPRVAIKTVRRAVEAAAGDLPLFAGGKSMGGRMTSLAQAEEPLPGVRGLIFLGFPLHRPGRPGIERADHLAGVDLPMLFLQGTRDRLADLGLLTPVADRLPRATLHVVDGADHGFHVLKRSGRTDDEVLDELADAVARWTTSPAAGSA